MIPLNRETKDLADSSRIGRFDVAEGILVLLIFFIHAGWPVPDVNEAHYLAKAKHYWNPEWCAGDFFLESADAHGVFYWTFGWLTCWLSLTTVAWVGRILTWTVLAWSWVRLSRSLVSGRFYSVLSAALFVALCERTNLAGEWVVGGVEAKGFAYAFVFLGLEAAIRNRWNQAWIMLGIASAFHVLVGGWSVVLLGFAWVTAGSDRALLSSMIPGLAGGLLISLLGLGPALALTWGADPSIVVEANQIYVFQRLPHHLALHTLSSTEFAMRLLRHGALAAGFLALCRATDSEHGKRRLKAFVAGAVLIAAMGLVLSFLTRHQPDLAAKILRYYWFRMSDAALPVGVAILFTASIAQTLPRRPTIGVGWLVGGLLIAGAHFVSVTYSRHVDPRPRADIKMADYHDWVDVCEWISHHPLTDARFITPRASHTFKWRAGQAEIVNRKDIPQDSYGIVEWWHRMKAIHDRDDFDLTSSDILAREESKLAGAAEQFQATHVLTTTPPRLRFELLYCNRTFSVYRLPTPNAAELSAHE